VTTVAFFVIGNYYGGSLTGQGLRNVDDWKLEGIYRECAGQRRAGDTLSFRFPSLHAVL
jgi:hypothetical protein